MTSVGDIIPGLKPNDFKSPSPHFSWKELRSGGVNNPNNRSGALPVECWPSLGCLVGQLHILRGVLGDRPMQIVSGFRDYGNETSQHRLGKAADIRVDGVEHWRVAREIEALISAGLMMEGGLGIYDMPGDLWVHYDIRGTRARWRQNSAGKYVRLYHGPPK